MNYAILFVSFLFLDMKMEKVTETFSNEFANLCFRKESLKGVVQDYVISFNEKERDIEVVVGKTFGLVKELYQKLEGKNIKARLIAKINFANVSNEDIRSYHFPSYQAELVYDIEEFFRSHMTKIASRLDAFNKRGSNLLILNIEHIHLALSFI